MTMIRDAMHRVTKNPMEVAAAMAAGAFAPRLVGQTAFNFGVPIRVLPAVAGATMYYFMDDIQDTTSVVIGGAAGYMGPMIMERLR